MNGVAARRVRALRRNKVPTQSSPAEQKLPKKDVYGAESMVHEAYRPYTMYEGVEGHRPIVFGFRPNEER